MFQITMEDSKNKSASMAAFARLLEQPLYFQKAAKPFHFLDGDTDVSILVVNPNALNTGMYMIADGDTFTVSATPGNWVSYRIDDIRASIASSGVGEIILTIVPMHDGHSRWGEVAYRMEAKVGDHPLIGVPLYEM